MCILFLETFAQCPTWLFRLNRNEQAAPSHVNLNLTQMVPPPSSISSKPAVTQAQAPPNCVFLLFSNPPPSSLSYVPVPIVHASNIPTPPHCSFPSLGATLRGVSSYRSAAAVPTPHLQGNLNFQTCTIIIPSPTKCILSILT